MSADVSNVADASAFNSIKNYAVATGNVVTFSGAIGASSTITRTITITITRTESTMALLLYNYSGSPNTAADWLMGTGPIIYGNVTLDGGWGGVNIRSVLAWTASTLTITLTVDNNDSVAHNIVTAVDVTVKAALSAIAFA